MCCARAGRAQVVLSALQLDSLQQIRAAAPTLRKGPAGRRGLLAVLDYPVNLGRVCGTINTRRVARTPRASGAPTKARLVARPGEPITRARRTTSRVFPAPRLAIRQQRARPFATALAVGLELV